MEILGIDIGGSGVKGAPVDVEKGILLTERKRIPTPQPPTPDALGDVVAEEARHFKWQGPIGCTFPGVIKAGVVYTAANIDESWVGFNGQKLLEEKSGCRVLFLNDADAAGIAEMEFGAGQGHPGVVIMLTFGTGIGSAIFVDGRLLPNTEEVLPARAPVEVAGVLRLEVSVLPLAPSAEISISEVGACTPTGSSVFLRRRNNAPHHAYALIPSRLRLDQRIRALAKLDDSFDSIFSRADRLRFLKAYAGGPSPLLERKSIGRILEINAARKRRERARRAGRAGPSPPCRARSPSRASGRRHGA